MRILFLARHFSYLRNFDSAIRELATRGHQLHLSADREESLGGRAMVERIAADYRNVTVGWTPGRESGAWYELAARCGSASTIFAFSTLGTRRRRICGRGHGSVLPGPSWR